MVSQGTGCAKCLHFDNFIISTHKIILYLDSCGMASPVWHRLYAYKWYPFIKALCLYAGTAHCLRLVCMGVQLNCAGIKFPAQSHHREEHFKGLLSKTVEPQRNGFAKFPHTLQCGFRG